MNYKALIESIIFSSTSPISVEKISKISKIKTEDLREILSIIEKEYSSEDRGIYLGWTVNGYKFLTKPEYGEYVRKTSGERKRNVKEEYLEIISIIALKQPVNRRELEEIIGNKLYNTLSTLYKMGLIRRERVKGKRGYSYFASNKFFKLLNIKDRNEFLRVFK
jgi:segregation and condensation protein B